MSNTIAIRQELDSLIGNVTVALLELKCLSDLYDQAVLADEVVLTVRDQVIESLKNNC